MKKYVVPFSFFAAFILNIITCLVVWSYGHAAPGALPVHYSVVGGVDQTGSPALLLQLPVFAFLVMGLNAVLLWFLGNLGPYIRILCASTALVVSICILLASILLKLQGA